MPRSSQPTIKRIIAAASSLFYERGIRTVNMDMIIERAGFSRRTIYYHFRSKDELIAAYLLAQEEMILDLYQSWYADAQGPVAEKLRALFKGLGDAASKPGWAGCAFARTASELMDSPSHPSVRFAAMHKATVERWLTSQLQREGVEGAPRVARAVAVLLEGALTTMMFHRDAKYAYASAELAGRLIGNEHIATPRGVMPAAAGGGRSRGTGGSGRRPQPR